MGNMHGLDKHKQSLRLSTEKLPSVSPEKRDSFYNTPLGGTNSNVKNPATAMAIHILILAMSRLVGGHELLLYWPRLSRVD